MSLKNNAYVAAVALALGVTVDATAGHVCEGVLNDYPVSAFGFAEVDSTGRSLAVVSVDVGDGVKVRVVADALGNAKLFASADAVIALSKRCQMAANVAIQYRRFVSTGTVGDPVAALKSKYKSAKTEEATAVKQETALTQKVAAAVALGWDTSTGTPENLEYVDLTARKLSITEWKTLIGDKKTALAASLTAAGVDPATVV